jgi:hypothetical protein
LYMRLGKRIAFCGIDARTERTRKQVNYPDTYNMIFDRLEREFQEAHGEIKHLILLLGVPIAYPRLAWLENILSSPLIAPLRLLNKRFGVAGGLFNQFDGAVDLLDDLDDHYTAKHHKRERRDLIVRLQKLAEKYAVRITILGGDVHLCAFGRFYSNPNHDIAAENDPRYIPNIVSSAITNKPPPKAVANLLAKRNKIHHLRDGNTDETLLEFFDKQPGGNMKSADWNKATMPSRNYACITEIPDADDPAPIGENPTNGSDAPLTNGHLPDTGLEGKDRPSSTTTKKYGKSNGREPLHVGEEHAGSQHPAADGISNRGPTRGGLNISLRVEIDNRDPEGHTEGYGLSSAFLLFCTICLYFLLSSPIHSFPSFHVYVPIKVDKLTSMKPPQSQNSTSSPSPPRPPRPPHRPRHRPRARQPLPQRPRVPKSCCSACLRAPCFPVRPCE